MATTRFDNIKANTEIGTLTIRNGSEEVKFGIENFSDKTVDITPFDPTDITTAIGQLTQDVQGLENSKQNTLESGVSIKTVNGNSLLGSGDLVIQGGSGSGVTPEQVATMISEEVGAEEIAREQACDALESRIDAIDVRTGNMGAIASYNVQILTQSQYIALEEKDSHTFYFIIDEEPLDEEDNDE